MGVARVFTLETPYSGDELAGLSFEQANDFMFLDHLEHEPHELRRYGHFLWALEPVSFGATQAAPAGVTATATITNAGVNIAHNYVVTAVNSETGQESLQSVADDCLNDLTLDDNFNTIAWAAAADADRYVIYKEVNGVFGFIGGSAGLSFVDDNIAPDLSDTPPQETLPFADALDYPAVVAFHEQRLFHARTKNRPNGLYASGSADFRNHNSARPAKADDALSFALVGRKINTIQHLISMKVLLALTSDAVWAISSEGAFLKPDDIGLETHGFRGANGVRPEVVDDIAFFVTSKGDKIRTLGYQFEADGYRGNDITVFAQHFFHRRNVVEMAWCEHPMSTLWVVRDDGKLLALTWMAEQDVWGWSLHQTDGEVESVAAVTERGEDVLYAVIRRNVAGEQRRFVERMATTDWNTIVGANYLDRSRVYIGEPTADLRGMGHLEGQTVRAVVDGSVVSGLLVEDGQVTLPHAGSNIVIGLPYEAWVRTLPIVGSGRDGTTKGRTQQINTVSLRVTKTRGIEIGVGKNNVNGLDPTSSADEIAEDADGPMIYEVKTRDNEVLGSPTTLYSGELLQNIPASNWEEGGVVIRQPWPLPATITSISPVVNVGG
jgi:hypothetical protein